MFKRLFSYLFSRRTRMTHKIGEFMHQNPDLLVIVCDPKTDVIMTGYRNFATAAAIVPNGKDRAKVVKSVLSMSRLDKSVDRFLLQIDGAVFNIAKATRDKRRGQTPDGVVPAISINRPDAPVATA